MKIAIALGSKSDYTVMKNAEDILLQFGVPFETKVVSVHRALSYLMSWLETLQADIIIAGAGGAAHLPGVIASKVRIPVLGVPIKSKALNGLDSLLSIVQMPKGIPVGTLAVDGAENAALLAIAFLAIKYQELDIKLKNYRQELEDQIKLINLKNE